MKPRKTYKRIILTLVGMSVGIVAFIFVNRFLYPEKHMEAEGNISYKLQKMIGDMNRLAPLDIDTNLRFDSVFVNSDNLLAYKYTLLSTSKDSVNLNELEQKNRLSLIANIKKSSSMQLVREAQLTVVYYYVDKYGEPLSKIIIKPDMYMD